MDFRGEELAAIGSIWKCERRELTTSFDGIMVILSGFGAEPCSEPRAERDELAKINPMVTPVQRHGPRRASSR